MADLHTPRTLRGCNDRRQCSRKVSTLARKASTKPHLPTLELVQANRLPIFGELHSHCGRPDALQSAVCSAATTKFSSPCTRQCSASAANCLAPTASLARVLFICVHMGAPEYGALSAGQQRMKQAFCPAHTDNTLASTPSTCFDLLCARCNALQHPAIALYSLPATAQQPHSRSIMDNLGWQLSCFLKEERERASAHAHMSLRRGLSSAVPEHFHQILPFLFRPSITHSGDGIPPALKLNATKPISMLCDVQIRQLARSRA